MKKKLIVILIVISSIQLLKAQQIGDGWEQTVADFSQVLSSGGYSYPSPLAGVPDTDHPWQHLFVLRHQNSANNHQLQIGASYAVNDRLFFRKIAVGDLSQVNTQWNELATRNSNTFNGNQTVNGSLSTKEFSIMSDESLPSGWGITHFYWKGHTLFLGSPRGSWTHNQVVFRPGGSSSSGQTCENYFSIERAISIDNYETCIQFSTDGTSNFIKNGNLLIGKTTQDNPDYKLDVAGSIRANEIKVNTTGADFVFEPTYKLRPLAEVETFINQHKHLPDVAPAADMQTNGVSMGEMQAKLLEKVEELTLYSIEQEKQLQEQKTQLQEQQQSNTDVRQQLAEQAKQNEELKQEIEQLKQFITQKLK